AMAYALGVVGLMNVQFAVQDGVVFVLEVNPRASRTVPFVSKATGVPLAKVGARCMAGISLKEQGVEKEVVPDFYAVKEAVFPFIKFPGVDTILGPEMRSTGEVMGVGASFGEAYYKAQLGAGERLNPTGKIFLSVREED
ncbi:TPA: carbamoyl phosphate synthase large subunit, partial [Neisseria meningitidis]